MTEFTVDEANRRIADLKKGNAELFALNAKLTDEMQRLAMRVNEIAESWGTRPAAAEKLQKVEKPVPSADDIRKAMDTMTPEERNTLLIKAALKATGQEIRPGRRNS